MVENPVTDGEIAGWRAHSAQHPLIAAELDDFYAGRAPLDTLIAPERVLERRQRLKRTLRQLARKARSGAERTEVKRLLVDAVLAGDLAITTARDAAAWMERRR